MQTELRIVVSMALLRLLAGSIEITAALLMLKFGRVHTAMKINGILGLIGPIILTLVSALGLLGLAQQLPPTRVLAAAGVALIFSALGKTQKGSAAPPYFSYGYILYKAGQRGLFPADGADCRSRPPPVLSPMEAGMGTDPYRRRSRYHS